MEVSSSVATGSLRVALQVVTNFRRPILEVYERLRNVSGPPIELPTHDSRGQIAGSQTHRFEDSFFDISLVNIGGVRAENVHVSFTGSSNMFPGARVPRIVADGSISKLPPGQSVLLLKIQSHHAMNAKSGFRLTLDYDAPNEGIGRVLRAWARFRGRPQYTYIYAFDPSLYEGAHLPSPEYNG